MPTDTNSVAFLTAYDAQPEIRNDVENVAINWFVNRTPLVTRLAKRPVGSVHYTIVTRKYRPRAFTLAGALTAVAAGTAGTLTLNDTSPLMNGDVVEITNTAGTAVERIEITADPVPSANTAACTRGVEGTTPVANDLSGTVTVKLIGNSRTGAEINQSATNYLPTFIDQYNQTFQHPVQVGGSLQSSTSFVPAPDASTPFDQAKMQALQNLMDDQEVTTYYGMGQAPTAGTSRPRQKGIRTQLTTNKTSNPTNKAAYKPTDLIRDTLQACRALGGNPNTLVMSPDWMSGLATWGHAAQRITAGTNTYGTPIDLFEAPFLVGVNLVFAPLLGAGTVICLDAREVVWRKKRAVYWNPRGVRGDAVEGDWMAEGSIEVENEYHHAWVEGITGFSAT